ncbi:MAG: phosphoribosylformylglycinamidine synthase I [Chloroflexi bacterium]|nr:phosphoribosylformylglycinamidine synthase I [Chloroflexota bacterium]
MGTLKLPRVKLSRPDQKRVAILHARGTNRDREAFLACDVAGGDPEYVLVTDLLSGQKNLMDYHMVLLPGGFSHGDDLGAGVIWSVTMQQGLDGSLARFADDGRPLLGICNGFQVLIKAGLLPGADFLRNGKRSVTLTHNDSGRFECRWVYLRSNRNSPSLFTRKVSDLILCPVAHGEGRVAVADEATGQALWDAQLPALTYVDSSGQPVDYPGNPNGSVDGIAALTNPAGNVLGLMPHPEDHIFSWQHPRHYRKETGLSGLRLFENGIKSA